MGEPAQKPERGDLVLSAEQQELPENQIYLIRDQKVMLDTDVAAMYEVDARQLIQSVRRNIERFPVDFVFRLTPQEFAQLKEKLPNPKDFERNRSTPYAFTEEGVVMVAHYLKSPRAIQVSNSAVQDFVRMRKLCGANLDFTEKLESMEDKYEQKFQQIFKVLRTLESVTKPPNERQIGFRI